LGFYDSVAELSVVGRWLSPLLGIGRYRKAVFDENLFS
jgi:hypothetical protein